MVIIILSQHKITAINEIWASQKKIQVGEYLKVHLSNEVYIGKSKVCYL